MEVKAAGKPVTQDPWNWKFPQRSDLMSLGKLSEDKDMCVVRTSHGIRTKRNTNTVLNTDDIKGKYIFLI